MILNLDCPSEFSEKHLKNSGPTVVRPHFQRFQILIQSVIVRAPGHQCFKAPGGFLSTLPQSIKASPSPGMTGRRAGPALPQISAPISCLGSGLANDRVPHMSNRLIKLSIKMNCKSPWKVTQLRGGPWRWAPLLAPLLTLRTPFCQHPLSCLLLLVSLFNRYILRPDHVLALEDIVAYKRGLAPALTGLKVCCENLVNMNYSTLFIHNVKSSEGKKYRTL